MANFNLTRFEIAGRICRDLEVKMIAGIGSSVLEVRVAVRRDRGEQGKEPPTDFFTVTVYGTMAETIGKYFRKGSSIFLAGAIRTNTFETRDSQKRTATVFVADSFKFVDSKAETEALGSVSAPSDDAPRFAGGTGAPSFEPVCFDAGNEGLPF
ncbi:MAG: single-stranded DNA-binding protein [Ruminococcaceae bacterium]|nr:single-stranded DNA-binding protein [Oscillospiraceae bacterium]